MRCSKCKQIAEYRLPDGSPVCEDHALEHLSKAQNQGPLPKIDA